MDHIFESERLYFRPWRLEDAERCFALSSDELVGPMCGWTPHKTADETRAVLRDILINDHTFAVVEKTTGEVIGNIGLDPVFDAAGNAVADERELGFWLGRPYWNRGYMTEAAKRAVKYCREVLRCKRLYCCYFTGNGQSARVQEKCGFKRKSVKTVFWKGLNREMELNCNVIEL